MVVGRFDRGQLTLVIFSVGLQIYLAMATFGLRVEDRLDGGGNWTPWKARIVLLLEECELWELVEYKKKNVRAKRIFLDLVKDHIIPHAVGNDFAFQMWVSLGNIYQSSN